ncbi:MAG: nuclear transport factor 2 family protein [Rhodobacteraceae bacterium]|nr:nuclear transport factor 2 family protein [Paracoccaceae bacterium]
MNTPPPRPDAFLALETSVWQAMVTGDAKADTALLTADFLGVYPSGFAGRADHAGQLEHGPVMQMFHLDQARLTVITPDHVLLSYRATYRRINGPQEVMYITSLWQHTTDGWMNSFSQDTPATLHPLDDTDH